MKIFSFENHFVKTENVIAFSFGVLLTLLIEVLLHLEPMLHSQYSTNIDGFDWAKDKGKITKLFLLQEDGTTVIIPRDRIDHITLRVKD